MDITNEDIESITTAVWATMIETELDVDPSRRSVSLAPSHTGVVSLSGAFRGEIVMFLSEGLVRGAASVMFDVPAAEVSAPQMVDAVAELTNMVGGNIKCLVEQPTKLGLPVVTAGQPSGLLDDEGDRTEVGFRCADGELVVVVHRSAA